MRNLVLLTLLVGMLPAFTFAQTATQLENAIREYTTLEESSNGSDVNFDDLFDMVDESKALLAQVIFNGTLEEQRTARYFLNLVTHLEVEIMAASGALTLDETKELLTKLQPEFERLNETEFPIRYQYEGSAYVINYANFEPIRQTFYVENAETYLKLGDQTNTRKYARKALKTNAHKEPYTDYFMHYCLFFMASNDEESYENAREMLSIYGMLSESDRASLEKASAGKVYLDKALKVLSEGKGLPANAEVGGAASLGIAKDLKKTGVYDTEAAQFYLKAFEKGARPALDESWEILGFHEKLGLKTAGLKIAYRVEKSIALDDCSALDQMGTYFKKFGDNTKYAAYQASAEKCRLAAQKRAEEEAKRQKKAMRKSNRERIYLGTYILRLAQRPQYMDYGAALNIPVKQSYIELSYMKARNDQDYLLPERIGQKDEIGDIDNPHWDGFYAHVGWKKRSQKTENKYAGILINYNQRNFKPLVSDVAKDASTVPAAFAKTFTPKQVSYGAMFNFGYMKVSKYFGVDMYYGIGATYNQFDLQDTTYPREEYLYSNEFLERRKDQFWSFQIRLGFTVGLSL